MKTKYIIFDLDDTLLYEIDFLKSAYREIAQRISFKDSENLYQNMIEKYYKKDNVFEYLISEYQCVTKEELLNIYRNHIPNIIPNENVIEILTFCKSKGYRLGIITDGRSVTQRNKLRALGIEHFFDKIIISEEFGSEKPSKENYLIFQEKNTEEYYYIGDNPRKDFITPNLLGWKSVCIKDKGDNIHQQNFDLDKEYLPQYIIIDIVELKNIIEL